jgi:DNA repair protein RadC
MRFIDSQSSVLDVINRMPRFDPDETGYVLYLNGKLGLISSDVYRGKSGTVSIRIYDVRDRASFLRASGVILIHTHPGGIPYESVEDRAAAIAHRKFLESSGMALYDNFILCKGELRSFLKYSVSH